MAFSFTPYSLLSEGPTAEHIEYALPTQDSLLTTTDTSTSPNITYHHIQHFLPDGTPGASSTHIEYADQYDPSSSFSLSPPTPIFTPRRPATTTTTRPRREQGTGSPSTSSTSTSSSTSPPRSPGIHVRFAGDLSLPLRSSPSPPQASSSGSTSTSSSRPRLHRNRASSPYPVIPSAAPGRGATDSSAEAEAEFGRALRSSSRSEGAGEEAGVVDLRTCDDGGEDGVCGSGGGVG